MVHDEVVLEIDSEHLVAGKQWLEENMLEGMKEVLGPQVLESIEITVADNWERWSSNTELPAPSSTSGCPITLDARLIIALYNELVVECLEDQA